MEDNSADTAARATFESGRTAYDEGRFGEALAHYNYAYELSHRSGLLFNIGRAAEADGQPARAISAYASYLEANPAADNRAFVEARLAKLREASTAPLAPLSSPAHASVSPAAAAATITQSETAPSNSRLAIAQQAPGDHADRPSRPLWSRPWFWGACGAVVVGAVVAGVVIATRSDGPTRAEADEHIMALVRP